MASDPVLDHAPREGVRTFTPRWRNSPLTDERMATLLPARSLPDGPLVPRRRRSDGSGRSCSRSARATVPRPSPTAPPTPRPTSSPWRCTCPGWPGCSLLRPRRPGSPTSRVHPGDAMPLLTDRVPAGSLAAVHLFFPDPGPKNKHAKRRFVQQHTLDLLAVAAGARRRAADRHRHRRVCRARPHPAGQPRPVGRRRGRERPPWRPDDGFEAKGVRAGRTVTELTCTLRPS